jgi:predicted kinase
MTTLTLVRGLPGSGKSTYARQLLAPRTQHLEADMYFVDPEGNHTFNPSRLHAAHVWCLDRTTSLLIGGTNVIVSNTFTTMKEMQTYLDVARRHSLKLEVIEMRTQYSSIHGVPEATMDKMRARWVTLPEDFNVKVIQ